MLLSTLIRFIAIDLERRPRATFAGSVNDYCRRYSMGLPELALTLRQSILRELGDEARACIDHYGLPSNPMGFAGPALAQWLQAREHACTLLYLVAARLESEHAAHERVATGIARRVSVSLARHLH